VVEQPAGRGDQHIDAAHQLVVLIVKRNAADDEGDVELMVLAVLVEAVLDLGRELAGRLRISVRGMAPARGLAPACQHRQGEGCGLAGTGLRDAENVSPGEDVGDRLFLDRGGSGIAGRGDGGENLVGQAELGKGHKASMKDRPEPRRITKMTVMRGRTVESTFVPLRGNIGANRRKSMLWAVLS
jgi:hypothetical protein